MSTGAHANDNQEGVHPSHVANPFFQPRVEDMAWRRPAAEGV